MDFSEVYSYTNTTHMSIREVSIQYADYQFEVARAAISISIFKLESSVASASCIY